MELGKGCLTSEVQNKDKAWSHEKGTGNRLGGGGSQGRASIFAKV